MLSAFKNLTTKTAAAIAILGFSAATSPVHADEGIREALVQALNNAEAAHLKLEQLGYTRDVETGLAQIADARSALENSDDNTLNNAFENIKNMNEVFLADDVVLDAVYDLEEQLKEQSLISNISTLTKFNYKSDTLSSLSEVTEPSTELTDVDTEELVLEICQDQLALQASTTALRTAFFAADAAAEIVPVDIVAAGSNIPNPVKAVLVAVKFTAKTALFVLDESIKLNALCTLRNERKIAREYIQARQVRFTPRKEISAKFDVVRPQNRGRDGWRYTFWMHLTKDGQPTNAEVTKVVASRLRDADDNWVVMDESLITVTPAGTGLYKLVLDTPVNQNVDYVRGFIVHLEHTHTSPGDSEYKHYGVGHIRSDVNSKDF